MGGLESKFGWGPRPLDRRVVGWCCLCLGYKWSVCFGVPSWDTLVHESSYDMVRVLVCVICCVLWPRRLSLVALFCLSVSVKDRPLLWILVRSLTYYTKYILVYGSTEGSLLSYHGFRLFLDRLIGGGKGGGLSTILRPGLKCGGLEFKFG